MSKSRRYFALLNSLLFIIEKIRQKLISRLISPLIEGLSVLTLLSLLKYSLQYGFFLDL